MNIYIANIPYSMNDEELKGLFTEFGEVTSAKIVINKFNQKSRGFGFVEMEQGGETAIESLNGREVGGRALVVNEAKPMGERPPRQNNDRRGGSGGGGGFRPRRENNDNERY